MADRPQSSYRKVVADLLSVVITLMLIFWFGMRRPSSPKKPDVGSAPAPTHAPLQVATPAKKQAIRPQLDLAAVAQAKARLASAKMERAGALDREAEAAERLRLAQLDAAGATEAARALANRIKDPTVRISRAESRLAVLRSQRDEIGRDLAAITGAPRPARKRLIDKSPVARPPDGEEFHFEVRRDRVAFIDLERLVERVKSDVRVQARLAGLNRPVSGQVGPIGAFSLRYEVGRTMPDSLAEFAQSRGAMSYHLEGWELVPESDRRGETYANTKDPASDYARAINRLSPSRSTVTMWIYPDGFALYRRLRDDLHARGFLVAARPLPDGMAIRGSPSGTRSAGQ
jgi:hypothetical protein